MITRWQEEIESVYGISTFAYNRPSRYIFSHACFLASIFDVGFEKKSARRGRDLHEARNIIIETAVLGRVRKWLGGGFSHRRPPANSAASKLSCPAAANLSAQGVERVGGGGIPPLENFRATIFEIR